MFPRKYEAAQLFVFSIDNNQNCFLSSKSSWFLKDHVTLKTGVMMQWRN